ncbi:SRPBCC family protein [Cohnella caldifontis]|uniref:SRPBCC family protein n=1 Tax=Cohnella caldifontis TaxID=3027471 RepID=UPI0023EA8621|nr:SRPBCC domain-containing protein [Cohnella sp. YIM B05605]
MHPLDWTLVRVLDAPPEQVFRVWTEPEHLMRWWAPKGADLLILHHEPRPEGLFLYRLRLPGGQVAHGQCVYREIQAPDRLVFDYTSNMESKRMNNRPPSDVWRIRLTLQEAGSGTVATLQGTLLEVRRKERHAAWTESDAGVLLQFIGV